MNQKVVLIGKYTIKKDWVPFTKYPNPFPLAKSFFSSNYIMQVKKLFCQRVKCSVCSGVVIIFPTNSLQQVFIAILCS